MFNSSLENLSQSILKQWIDSNIIAATKYSLLNTVSYFCNSPQPYRLLRVVAVLTAKDDGSQPLGTIKNGQVIPAEPYLRNPLKHKKDEDNYIKDWINLANLQLLFSGAYFGLDVDRISYILEPSTFLHKRECWDSKKDAQDTEAFFKQRAAESPDSPYKDSVILLFRWGKDPNKPSGQACSDVTSNHILMPGEYRDWPLYIGGELVFGNNHLTHEFGHFMGLTHTFPWLRDTLADLASKGNPKNFPLTVENLPEMQGVTEQDILSRKQQALDYIATWAYSLEQDTGGHQDAGIPDEYGIKDTPIDLGEGLPLLYGQNPCKGSYDYTFARYHHTDLQEKRDANGNFIWWEPKPGTVPNFNEHVTINDTVRRNIMSYWLCDPEGKRFSSDQVERMNYVLDNLRSKLVGRTINLGKTGAVPCWVLKLPILVKKFLPPWEPIIKVLLFPWELVQLIFMPKYREASMVVSQIVQGYKPWNTDDLAAYISKRKQAQRFFEPQSVISQMPFYSSVSKQHIKGVFDNVPHDQAM